MRTEELTQGGGLFSGLADMAKLNQLVDEFYGDLLQEEKVLQGKIVAMPPDVTQYFFSVPPGLESAAKNKQTE